MPYDDGGTPPAVAGAYQLMGGKYQHATRALDMPVHVLDALSEAVSLYQQLRHQFGGVGTAHRHLGETHVLGQQLARQFVYVDYLGHRTDGERPQVRVDYQWLCIGIADDADARLTAFETVECRLELGAKIRAFEVVNRADEPFILTVGCHTSPAGTEVRVVVGPVKQVGHTTLLGNCSENTSHKNVEYIVSVCCQPDCAGRNRCSWR